MPEHTLREQIKERQRIQAAADRDRPARKKKVKVGKPKRSGVRKKAPKPKASSADVKIDALNKQIQILKDQGADPDLIAELRKRIADAKK